MDDDVPARSSLRSRSAAAVNSMLLRPITGLIPPDHGFHALPRLAPAASRATAHAARFIADSPGRPTTGKAG